MFPVEDKLLTLPLSCILSSKNDQKRIQPLSWFLIFSCLQGLQVDDEIVEFGSVNTQNFQSLQNVGTVVQHSEGVSLGASQTTEACCSHSSEGRVEVQEQSITDSGSGRGVSWSIVCTNDGSLILSPGLHPHKCHPSKVQSPTPSHQGVSLTK